MRARARRLERSFLVRGPSSPIPRGSTLRRPIREPQTARSRPHRLRRIQRVIVACWRIWMLISHTRCRADDCASPTCHPRSGTPASCCRCSMPSRIARSDPPAGGDDRRLYLPGQSRRDLPSLDGGSLYLAGARRRIASYRQYPRRAAPVPEFVVGGRCRNSNFPNLLGHCCASFVRISMCFSRRYSLRTGVGV